MQRSLTLDQMLLLIEGFSDGLYHNQDGVTLDYEIESIIEYVEEKTTDKKVIKEILKAYINKIQDCFVAHHEYVKYCDHCGPCVRENPYDFVKCSECKTDICDECAVDFNHLCESCQK